MISQLRKRYLNAKSDERGISAVEFALILPVMTALYLGGAELTLAMTLDRKVTGATAALGDLTARAAHLTNDDLSDIFEATRMVMQPNDISKAEMRITSVSYTAADENAGTPGADAVVVWSDTCDAGSGGTYSNLSAGDDFEVPQNLVPDGGTLIIAEITFPYESPIEFFFPASKPLSDTFYLRPRRVDSITRDDTVGTLKCGFTPVTP